jgi:hypothetical protein
MDRGNQMPISKLHLRMLDRPTLSYFSPVQPDRLPHAAGVGAGGTVEVYWAAEGWQREGYGSTHAKLMSS